VEVAAEVLLLDEGRELPAAGRLETAGGLYLADPSDAWTVGEHITIQSAGEPGRSFRSTRQWFEFDPVELDDACDGLTGIWHSHPTSGVARLSRRDLEAFTRTRRKLRRPPFRFVAIIAAPDDPLRMKARAIPDEVVSKFKQA